LNDIELSVLRDRTPSNQLQKPFKIQPVGSMRVALLGYGVDLYQTHQAPVCPMLSNHMRSGDVVGDTIDPRT
jgi:hypothetical protein